MSRRVSPLRILVLLIANASSWHSPCQLSGQEAVRHICFRHERRGEGVAKEPKWAYSPNRSVVVRVIGERFKADVRLFDAASDRHLGPPIELHAHRITALAVSPDNRLIATAIGNFSNDWGEVRVWNGKSGKEIAKYTICPGQDLPPLGEVFRVSFSDDGNTVTVISGPPGGR